MPHVASDFGAIHAPSHHHGTRGRAAKTDGLEPSSPFSELVDAAADDTPATRASGRGSKSGGAAAADEAPPLKDGGEPAPKPAGKAGSADEARTESSAPAADATATEDQIETLDAVAALQIALAADEAVPAETETEAADEEDTATDETASSDSIEAAIALPADATTPQVAADATLGEPNAAMMAAPAQVVAPPAEPTADDAAAAPADAAAAPTKATTAPTDAPVDAPTDAATAPTDAAAAPAAGARAGDSEKTQGTVKGRGHKDRIAGAKPAADAQAAGATAAKADEPAETETVASTETGREPTDTPASSPKPEHAPAANAHSDQHKPEVAAKPPLGAAVSEAAQGTNPPAEAVHAVLQANDRAAAANASAAPSQSLASQAAAVPLAGLAVEIAARAQAGSNRFEIRLDPPELGRIDVRLDIDSGGNVTSRLVVDRVETLDVLRRDAHQLERALQDAGLKTSDNGLQFSLRDQGMAGRDGARDQPNAARLVVSDPELPASADMQAGYGRPLRTGGGVDIRV